ncbi:hypothetical protein BCR44DRAFT_1424782 [Catenaria anguillulae PL171]|uniref:SH3 domain-containing protein n=1 Tax=Catenaria anguillulae PL171 TaxID=765915 RepID=A0A1Y2I2W8_9FUNG|nr:hypothetical protein BCR44DRAFT_1424782 [Catenaria anguillulae PL171]
MASTQPLSRRGSAIMGLPAGQSAASSRRPSEGPPSRGSPSPDPSMYQLSALYTSLEDKGYKIMVERLRAGKHSLKKLAEYVTSRITAETKYAAELNTMARTLLNEDIGTTCATLETLKAESEAMAKSHVDFASTLRNSIEKPLTELIAQQKVTREMHLTNAEKNMRRCTDAKQHFTRARDKFYTKQSELNSLRESIRNKYGKELERTQQKVTKGEVTLKELELAYVQAQDQLGQATRTWEYEWKKALVELENLELERMDAIRAYVAKMMLEYRNLTDKDGSPGSCGTRSITYDQSSSSQTASVATTITPDAYPSSQPPPSDADPPRRSNGGIVPMPSPQRVGTSTTSNSPSPPAATYLTPMDPGASLDPAMQPTAAAWTPSAYGPPPGTPGNAPGTEWQTPGPIPQTPYTPYAHGTLATVASNPTGSGVYPTTAAVASGMNGTPSAKAADLLPDSGANGGTSTSNIVQDPALIASSIAASGVAGGGEDGGLITMPAEILDPNIPARVECVVVTRFPYQATIAEELSFEAGEELPILTRHPDGWWLAETMRDPREPGVKKRGLIPSNFVQVIRHGP